MKITNLGLPATVLTSQSPLDDATATGASAAGLSPNGQGYTPSSELQQLISLVRQQPDIRDNLVQAATQRLQQGYYHTQASAEKTAGALLNELAGDVR